MENKSKKFSLRNRLKSFKHALRGLKILFREEHNARIHLGIGIVMYVLSSVLKLRKIEIVAILISIGFVLVTETINTAIDNLCDFVQAEHHDKIKRIKDISAATVLNSSIVFLIIGLVIYFPLLLNLFNQ